MEEVSLKSFLLSSCKYFSVLHAACVFRPSSPSRLRLISRLCHIAKWESATVEIKSFKTQPAEIYCPCSLRELIKPEDIESASALSRHLTHERKKTSEEWIVLHPNGSPSQSLSPTFLFLCLLMRPLSLFIRVALAQLFPPFRFFFLFYFLSSLASSLMDLITLPNSRARFKDPFVNFVVCYAW